MHDRHAKHFEQWRAKYVYLTLGGYSIPAIAFANWLLSQDPPLTELPRQYASITHMQTGNVQVFYCLLQKIFIQRSFILTVFTGHLTAIREITEGKQLWVSNMSLTISKFRKYIKSNWLHIVTNI